MTSEEYKAFWHRSAMAFPRIAEFFTVLDFNSKAELSEEDRDERHHLWKQVFFPLDNEDCLKSLADMVDGKISGPGWDCSDFPAKIRAQASEYRNRRARQLANDGLHKSLRGDGERQVVTQEGETAKACQYVLNRIGDMSKATRFDKQEAIRKALEEIWPEGEGHPVFPSDWQPKPTGPMLKKVS